MPHLVETGGCVAQLVAGALEHDEAGVPSLAEESPVAAACRQVGPVHGRHEAASRLHHCHVTRESVRDMIGCVLTQHTPGTRWVTHSSQRQSQIAFHVGYNVALNVNQLVPTLVE